MATKNQGSRMVSYFCLDVREVSSVSTGNLVWKDWNHSLL